MSTDDRSYILLSALSMDVESSAAYLYPRLLPLVKYLVFWALSAFYWLPNFI